MPATDSSAAILRFGAFELDLQTNELRRSGVLLKLAPQQLQVLRLLAENSGTLLAREDIQREVWGTGTFVDFDRNLNVCVAQIRSALNDDSDAPRFIQTIPKRGYRFIAPVERVTPKAEVPPLRPKPSIRILAAAAAVLAAIFLLAAAWVTWRRPQANERVMVAALPFENLSGDARQDLLTDGLTEELIGQLGSLNPLRLGVIGRSSVMRYKGAPHGLDQVGRALNVEYVLEGSLRESGSRIRISARLVKVADQAQVWTDTSERASSEMFRLEEEAAARIAAAVSEKLLGGAPAATPPASHNEEAWQAYLNGRYLQHKQTKEGLERSVGFFEQAATLDPRFDQAYSAEAETRVSLGRAALAPPGDTFPRARTAAEKALAIREANAEAHNALADALFLNEWNFSAAERHFTRALAINPSFSLAHHDYAFFLVAMGRTEQGLTSLRRAIALDPLSARVNIDAGWLLLQAHKFDDAIQQARRALELEPSLAEANSCILRSLFYQKKYRELLERLHAPAAGDPEQTLKRMYRERLSKTTDAFFEASSLAFLGENAKALDALDRAYAERSPMMPMLNTEPSLAPLHGEPRFQELARKLGL